MPMRQSSLIELTRDRLIPLLTAEKNRTAELDPWLRRDGKSPDLPRRATKEHRNLADIAGSPLLGTVITTMAQGLVADGFKSPDERDDAEVWATWQANDFDTRQSAVHRAALGYGLSYVMVTPGQDAEGPRSVMRGVSPRKMVAVYADPAEDDWPIYAIREDIQGASRLLRVIDEEAVYYLGTGAGYDGLEFIEYREHGAGVCPVVRYTNLLDLDGNATGEIEPLIPLAARYNKTTYDRLLTQHFNSWKVRWVTGLEKPADEAEAEEIKTKLRQEDLLVGEGESMRFGTLDETPLDGFIRAAEADLDTMSAVAQMPSTIFGAGKIANLSADTVAELRAGLNQKLYERKLSFGKSHAQALRLAARLEGRDEPPPSARVTWRDMSPRTIAQVVDGLAKAVDSLGVPPEGVWHMIPGVSKVDIDDWRKMAARSTGREALSALAEAARVARAADPAVLEANARRGDAAAG